MKLSAKTEVLQMFHIFQESDMIPLPRLSSRMIAITIAIVVLFSSLQFWGSILFPIASAAETFNPEAAATQMITAFQTFIKDMEEADVLEQPPDKSQEFEERFQARLNASLNQIVALGRTANEEQAHALGTRYVSGIAGLLAEHTQDLRRKLSTEHDFRKKGRLETWIRHWEQQSSQLASSAKEFRSDAQQDLHAEMNETRLSSSFVQHEIDINAVLHDLANPTGRFARSPGGEFAQHLATAQARTGDLYNAFHTTTGIRSAQERVQSYIMISEACAIIDDTKCIEATMKQLESDDLARKINHPYTSSLAQQAKVSALTTVFRVHAKKGNLAKAETTFSGIDYTDMRPELAEQSQRELLRELALAYVQQHNVKSAINAVGRIKKIENQDHALADVAIALAEAGEPEGARRTIELLRNHKPGTHLAPRVVEVLVKVGDKKEAASFLQPLLQEAIESRNEWAISYCVAAQAFLDPMHARELALSLPAKTGNTGYSRRDATFASIAVIQAKQNNVIGALETIELSRDPQTHDSTLQIMAEDFVKAHDLHYALQVAKAIKLPYWKSTLAKIQALTGNVSEAMRVATSLPTSFDKSQALSSIVEAQISAKALHDAVQTAEIIDHDNIKDRTYTALALAHARAGQIATSIQLIRQVLWQRQPGIVRQIGQIHASNGKWNDIWRFSQEQTKLPSKESLLLGMVEGMLDYKAAHK